MTETKLNKKTETARSVRAIAAAALLAFFAVVLSPASAEYFLKGLKLCIFSLVPVTFPFMIVSDIYYRFGEAERLSVIGRLFGLRGRAVGALICGALCGFPIGTKMSTALYEDGELSAKETQRLSAISSLPSVAFVIGAVGERIFKDVSCGFLLLFSIWISTFICAHLFGKTSDILVYSNVISRQRFDILATIKSAGTATVELCSAVIAFSIPIGFITALPIPEHVLLFIVSPLEITNALSFISQSSNITNVVKLALCAFTLGFGGICVMLQTASYLFSKRLSIVPYLKIKFAVGAISSAICPLLYWIKCMFC